MSKHTPGPWMCLVDRRDDEVVYLVCEHIETAIAMNSKLWTRGRPSGVGPKTDRFDYLQPDGYEEVPPHKIANARLIAAAPDLLAALETLLNATNDIEGLAGCSERTLAREAIRKAKGE